MAEESVRKRDKKRESVMKPEEASSSPSSKKTVEVTSASENFRHKKDTKAPVVTTIVRRPDQIASDEAAKLRDETSELAAVKIEGGIGAATDSYFQPYSANVYNNLNTIVRAARSINANTSTTEFVLIGWSGDGKSSLIESLIGLPLQPCSPTLRPIFFHVNQNSNLTAARFALGLETGLKNTTLADLPRELAELNKAFSDVPVHVLIERPSCVNMVLIDTPGLGGDDGVAKKAQNLIAQLASPQRRYVCVEAAPPRWYASPLRTLVAAIDPHGLRTTFVYTMAHIQFRNLVNHEQALRYIANRPVAHAFFVDCFSKATRASMTNPQDFSTRIVQAQLRLLRCTGALGLAPTTSAGACVGLKPLLTWMYETAIKDLEHQMPVIVDEMHAQDVQHEAELAAINDELDALAPHTMRAAASCWAGSFGRALVALLHGTTEANPDVNGQTLVEERAAADALSYAWATAPGEPIDVAVGDVERAGVKLYGAAQLARLMAEFRVAAARVRLAPASISAADLAALPPATCPTSTYARHALAAEIASRHALRAYGPLVVQLFGRATVVVNRLFDVALELVARWRQQQQPLKREKFDIDAFPFLQFKLRDTLVTAVAEIADGARVRALDDLRCFYFEQAPADVSNVAALAVSLFDQMRDHCLKNIVLKYQCFFVNRCANELATAIHGALATLEDNDIQEIFQLEEYRARLAQKAGTLALVQRRLAEAKNMLESRLVVAHDPSIRKSFIAPRHHKAADKAVAVEEKPRLPKTKAPSRSDRE